MAEVEVVPLGIASTISQEQHSSVIAMKDIKVNNHALSPPFPKPSNPNFDINNFIIPPQPPSKVYISVFAHKLFVKIPLTPIKTIKNNMVETLNMLGLTKRIEDRFLLTSRSYAYGDVLAIDKQMRHMGIANLTISFASELLHSAEELIRRGLHPSKIMNGYTKAINKTVETLDKLVEEGSDNMNVFDKEQVVSRIKAVVFSKQFGQEDTICSLVAGACIQVCPKNYVNFNMDNVHVAKLLGGGLRNSTVVRRMVLRNDIVGSIKRMEKAKVVVFSGGVDTSITKNQGTVLIRSAKQLENSSKTKEDKVEELIKEVGELALHFCECYKLMVLKISSKFKLHRFFHTTGVVAMSKLIQPNPDDVRYVDSILVEEIGGARVTIVKKEEGGNSVSIVVLRGSIDSILDDIERAVDDKVNSYKAMCRDSRIVPETAATGIELAKWVKEFSFKETGLGQYAIAKSAECF
ncbi:unnamed protein product [Lathyrus sativus]|nr:unnamed protein product [Lathyrus sativus]